MIRLRRRGSAAVEFAILLPAFVVALMGMLDYGLALDQRLQLQNAARAGAQFALRDPTDTAGIQTAARNAAPGLTGIVFPSAPTQSCQCVTTSNATPPVTTRTNMARCNDPCAGTNARVVGFVTVDVRHSYSRLTAFAPSSVSASATIQYR